MRYLRALFVTAIAGTLLAGIPARAAFSGANGPIAFTVKSIEGVAQAFISFYTKENSLCRRASLAVPA